ncbi:MAG: aquaporin family protein [Candidatus Caenarcaniphilales bacterium]|nr:aquaporin family protein [Candidatus Caenarcaniphilales bacterium]
MQDYIAEFIGTLILVALGTGVNANSSLKKTFTQESSNWLLISVGWALAVYVAVVIAAPYSGAHINPAVTFALAIAGKFSWNKVLLYVFAQILGAISGALITYIFFWNQFKLCKDKSLKLSCFATGPAIKDNLNNFFSEFFATFILVFSVLYLANASIASELDSSLKLGLGSLGALPVALIVMSIGISLGGTTGYAINPARDLGPRIIHSVLVNADSNWSYAWIPVFAPLGASALAALLSIIIGS